MIKCILSGCSHAFTNFYTYGDHVYAYHSDSDSDCSQVAIPPISLREIVSVSDHDGFSDVSIDVEEPSASLSPEVMIERAAAMWILKTKKNVLYSSIKYRINYPGCTKLFAASIGTCTFNNQ